MNKLLVVVDVQNDFVSGALGSDEAKAIVPKIVDKISNIDESTGVIFTRDTHDLRYLETQEGEFLPIPHCLKWSGGWDIDNDVFTAYDNNKNKAEVLIDDKPIVFVDKPTFGSPELIKVIRRIINKYKLDSIEFVGLCTDICVVTNVALIKTYFPEIKVYVCEPCCAGVTVEKHKSAIDVLDSIQAIVTYE